MVTYFDEGFHIEMTLAEARACSHPGPCDDDVRRLVSTQKIRRQLDKIGPELIRAELKMTGGWDDEELADDSANRERLVWIAAGQIVEEHRARRAG